MLEESIGLQQKEKGMSPYTRKEYRKEKVMSPNARREHRREKGMSPARTDMGGHFSVSCYLSCLLNTSIRLFMFVSVDEYSLLKIFSVLLK